MTENVWRKRAWLVPALGVFLSALAVRLAYWAYAGTRVSPDGHTYLGTCHPLVEAPWSTLTGFVGIEYLAFIAPFCGFLALPYTSLDHWVILQIVMTSSGAVLLFDAARRMWGTLSGLVAGLGLAFLWETAQWDVYILSESTFILAMCFMLWTMALHRTQAGGARRLMWVALALVAVARPVGAPIVMGLLFWDAVFRVPKWRVDIVPKRWMAVTVVLSALVLMFGVSDRADWAESSTYMVWSEGLLVHDDPTFSYRYDAEPADTAMGFALQNLDALIIMAFLKSLLFFLPVVWRFSALHNGVNLVTLVPLLVLAGAGMVSMIRRREPGWLLWLSPVLVMILVSAITFIDYDWRYRAPAGPVFAIMAAYVFSEGSRLNEGLRRLWSKRPNAGMRSASDS